MLKFHKVGFIAYFQMAMLIEGLSLEMLLCLPFFKLHQDLNQCQQSSS